MSRRPAPSSAAPQQAPASPRRAPAPWIVALALAALAAFVWVVFLRDAPVPVGPATAPTAAAKPAPADGEPESVEPEGE